MSETKATKPEEQLLGPFDLSAELYREYDFDGRTYQIFNPKALYYRPAGSTHRILDQQGVIHCVPFGRGTGSVLRWKNREGKDPVQF